MTVQRLPLLLFALFLAGVGITLSVYYGYYLQEYRTVPVDFHVRKGVAGLNGDTDALHFGTLTPGGTGRRSMMVTPAHAGRLVILFRGEAAPFLSVVPNNVLVEQGLPLRLNFTAALPVDAALGNYTGEARFLFYRR